MSEGTHWRHISVNHLVVRDDGATRIKLEHDHPKFVILKPWFLETGRANTL